MTLSPCANLAPRAVRLRGWSYLDSLRCVCARSTYSAMARSINRLMDGLNSIRAASVSSDSMFAAVRVTLIAFFRCSTFRAIAGNVTTSQTMLHSPFKIFLTRTIRYNTMHWRSIIFHRVRRAMINRRDVWNRKERTP